MFKNYKSLALLMIGLLTTSAFGQAAYNNGQFQPFDEIPPSDTKLGMSVNNRVLYFAHFTCPYCRQAHQYLEEWGDGLPRPYTLEVVPAVGLQEHMPMAMAYYAVLQIAPKRLPQFQNALFSHLQDRSRDPGRPETFKSAAASIGLDVEAFQNAMTSTTTRKYVERAYLLTNMYGVQEVPTVIVANRFRTSPARVQNEREAFLTVLNGLVSMHYRDRK